MKFYTRVLTNSVTLLSTISLYLKLPYLPNQNFQNLPYFQTNLTIHSEFSSFIGIFSTEDIPLFLHTHTQRQRESHSYRDGNRSNRVGFWIKSRSDMTDVGYWSGTSNRSIGSGSV